MITALLLWFLGGKDGSGQGGYNGSGPQVAQEILQGFSGAGLHRGRECRDPLPL
jgi:hypothetical protein